MVTVAGVGSKWALGLNGEGYLLSTLDQESPFDYRAYTLLGVPIQIPRIDLSDEPGEHSLGSLWPRAQHSWHEGGDQEVFDSEFSSRFKFHKAKHINVWEKGKISLLPGHEDFSVSGTDTFGGFILVDEDAGVFFCRGDVIQKQATYGTNQGSTTSPAGAYDGNTGWNHCTSDGKFIYVPNDGGIYRADMTISWASVPTWTKINNLISVDIVKFVKGRMLAGKGPALHHITDLTDDTSGATAMYTAINATWLWTSIDELGPGIYCSGFDGAESAIFQIGFDTSDAAAGDIIGVPRQVWKAPKGEKIYNIHAYSGIALLIGTNKGIRAAIVKDQAGNLEVTTLIAETNQPVRSLYVEEDFGYFGFGQGYEDGADVDLVTGKIDLGTLNWAPDITIDSAGPPLGANDFIGSVARFKSKTMISWQDDSLGNSEWFGEHSTGVIFSGGGFVTTGEVRYGTFEKKSLRRLEALTDPIGIYFDVPGPVDTFTACQIQAPNPAANVTFVGHDSRIKVGLDDWTPTDQTVLYESKDQFRLVVVGTNLDVSWKFDSDLSFSSFSFAHGFTDGTVNFVRFVADCVADTVTYFTSVNEGDTWVQQGQFTAIGKTSINPHAALDVIVAGDQAGNINTSPLNVYRFEFLTDTGSGFISECNLRPTAFQPDTKGVNWAFKDRTTGLVCTSITIKSTDSLMDFELNIDQLGFQSIATGLTGRILVNLSTFVGTRFDLKILLKRSVADTTLGSILLEWRLLADPVQSPRFFRYRIPIMLYDDMTMLDGQRISRRGYAIDQLANLETIYRDDLSVELQKPSYYHVATTVDVRIEDMEFKSFASPHGAGGFGGICLLTLREME